MPLHVGEDQRVEFLAVGGEVDHYGTLSEDGVRQFDEINRHLARAWDGADDQSKAFLTAASGSLVKLSASLLQVHRMRLHHDALLGAGKANGAALEKQENEAIALQGKEACADFEALLLQARAALDRLTFFLNHQFFPAERHKSDRFSKLLGAIRKAKRPSTEMTATEAILAEVEWLVRFFTEVSGRSLRSFVAHRLAVLEWMDTCFTITRLPDGRFLFFDGVVNRVPVFTTSLRISEQLACVVLNCVAIFTTGTRLPLAAYAAPCTNRTVVLADYISDVETPLLQLIAKRMTPGGFDFEFQYLRQDVLRHAVVLGDL